MENKRVMLGNQSYKPITAKILRIFCIVTSIPIILIGALTCFVLPIFGIICVVVGLGLFLYARNIKNKLRELEVPINTVNTSTVTISAPSVEPPPKIEPIPESEKNYNLFLNYDADNDTYLAYSYEVDLAFADTSALTGNGGKLLNLRQEPQNEYDNKAVAVYFHDTKVGYLYRGKIQDMVNDWFRRNEPTMCHINKIDTANNTATIKIGFYKYADELSMRKFKLTRITKKEDEFGGSRYENLSCCSDGDLVDYCASYETDNYIITDECGEELGEVSTKAVEFIDEYKESIKFMKINNIENTDNGGYKADIEVFYKE